VVGVVGAVRVVVVVAGGDSGKVRVTVVVVVGTV
jgi:hypothetical protein